MGRKIIRSLHVLYDDNKDENAQEDLTPPMPMPAMPAQEAANTSNAQEDLTPPMPMPAMPAQEAANTSNAQEDLTPPMPMPAMPAQEAANTSNADDMLLPEEIEVLQQLCSSEADCQFLTLLVPSSLLLLLVKVEREGEERLQRAGLRRARKQETMSSWLRRSGESRPSMGSTCLRSSGWASLKKKTHGSQRVICPLMWLPVSS
ncbi:uncharacterized protein LOC135486557 [Lineus longissimus]|uniref:uncharacterized protein LOC135486557 n=1 Tax=Lineus longissimus TaxID=88925 RepID=UPI002B4DCF1B